MKKIDIISIGSALRDVLFYTSEGEVVNNPKKDVTKLKLLGFELGAKLKSAEVYFAWGGGAINTAVNFAGLGLRTGIKAAVGSDMDGREIIDYLRSRQVETSLIVKNQKERTGFSFLAIDQKSREHTVFVYYGANRELRMKNEELKINTDWYYVSSLNSKYWPEIMRQLISTRKKITWNPGQEQLAKGYRGLINYLSGIEVFILNRDEATELCLSKKAGAWSVKEMLQEIFAWGPALVVITEGAKGVQAYDGCRFYQDRPHHGRPKDTTGAGDCFASSLVAGLIKFPGQIKLAMKIGIINSSSLVMRPGAQNGLLSWAQIKKKL